MKPTQFDPQDVAMSAKHFNTATEWLVGAPWGVRKRLKKLRNTVDNILGLRA